MNQTTKHTAGPWRACCRSMSDGSLVVKSSEFIEICQVVAREDRKHGPDDDRQRADADLIASAPTLLRQRDELASALKACAEAIRHLYRDGTMTEGIMVGLGNAANQARAALASIEKGVK